MPILPRPTVNQAARGGNRHRECSKMLGVLDAAKLGLGHVQLWPLFLYYLFCFRLYTVVRVDKSVSEDILKAQSHFSQTDLCATFFLKSINCFCFWFWLCCLMFLWSLNFTTCPIFYIFILFLPLIADISEL